MAEKDKYSGRFDNLTPAPPEVPQGDEYSGRFDGLAPKPVQATSNDASPVAQDRSAVRLPRMAGHALATGAQTLVGLPGTLKEAGNKLLPDWMTKEVRIGTDPKDGKFGLYMAKDENSFPTGAEISAATGMGLENQPDLKPETALERYGSAIFAALPAVPLAMAGGLGVVPALVTTEAGAVASQAAADVAPGNKWLPPVAGVIGSLSAGGLVSKVQQGIATSKAWTRLTEAEKSLDDVRTAAMAGRESAAKAATKVTSAANGIVTARKQVADELIKSVDDQVGKVVDDTAASLGKSKTLQEAGTGLQTAAREWKEKIFPKQLQDVAKPLNAAVPDQTPTDLDGFTQALEQITSSGGKLKPLIAELTPKLPARLKSVLEAGDEAAELGGGAVSYTWGEVRELRSALGDALGNPKIVNDIGEQNLRHLYSVVTGDLRAVAKRANAAELFDEYNKVSTELYNLAGGPISRLINSTNKALETVKPEKIAAELISEGKLGATDLAALRSAIPGAMDDLGAVALRNGEFPGLSLEARTVLYGAKAADLDSAFGLKDQAAKNAKIVVEAAKKEAAKIKLEAKQAAIAGKFGREKSLAAAKQELKEAKAAVPAPVNPMTQMATSVNRLIGGGGAYAAAEPLLNALSLPSGPGAQATIGALGLGLPALVSGGKELLRNPRSAIPPLTGGVVGMNPLAIQSSTAPR